MIEYSTESSRSSPSRVSRSPRSLTPVEAVLSRLRKTNAGKSPVQWMRDRRPTPSITQLSGQTIDAVSSTAMPPSSPSGIR